MAVDANSFTLGDLARISNEPAIVQTTMSLIEAGSLFTDIPLKTKKSLIVRGARWEEASASVTWRDLNEEPTATKSTPATWSEQVYIARDNVDIDEFIAMDENSFEDPWSSNINAYLRKLAFDLNDKFINNDHKTGNTKCFVGLRARLDDPKKYGTNSECKIDASSVDLSDSSLGTNGSAPGRRLSRKIQEALDAMGRPNGDGVAIYGNDDVIRRWEESLRAGNGGFSMTKDSYDRNVPSFRNAIIRHAGRVAPVKATTGLITQAQVITSYETVAGVPGTLGTDKYSSIYLAYLDQANGFAGWQMVPPRFKPRTTNDNNVIDRATFSWAVGLKQNNTRAIARLFGVKTDG